MESWGNDSVYFLTISETHSQTCLNEVFQGRCPYSQNILVTSAKYGHIEISRCVDDLFAGIGSLGCYANITDIIGQKCNGKARCEIAIPEDEEITSTKACKTGLPMYMDIRYVCVPGES